MRKTSLILLTAALVLGGCASVRDSRLNPLNWFGASEGRASAARGEDAVKYQSTQDPRPLVDQVVAMSVESIPEGAILRATGLPATQGYWAAELVEVTGEGIDPGVLLFDFRIIPPPYAATAGAPYTREVEAASYLSFKDLEGVGRIVVRGQRTERSVRR